MLQWAACVSRHAGVCRGTGGKRNAPTSRHSQFSYQTVRNLVNCVEAPPPYIRRLRSEDRRCPALPTTRFSELSGAKATVPRPWGALTNASRAAGGIHDVIVWQSPPATDVAPTKRLITKSRVQGCRASGRDASTPGGNHWHVGNAQATRYGLLLGLTRVCHCKRQDGGGCRAMNQSDLLGVLLRLRTVT